MKNRIISLIIVVMLICMMLPADIAMARSHRVHGPGATNETQTATIETNESSLVVDLVADFDFNVPECPLCEGITFTDKSTGGVKPYEYYWDFGDGSSINGTKKKLTHYYAGYGNYTVTLTVTDRARNAASKSETITLNSASKADTEPVGVHDPTAINETATNEINETLFCTATGDYTVCTDKEDYASGETVPISGSGFTPGANLTIKITRPDGSVVTGDGSFAPWPTAYDAVIADLDGKFDYNYVLDGIQGEYLVEVLDGDGNVLASHTFTDSRTINWVTLTYGTQIDQTSVTVPPGATITAKVNVTTSGRGQSNDWESTSWRISTTSGSMTCENTPNHTSSDTYTESFPITAPSTAGTYNAYFRVHNGNSCSSDGQSELSTMINAVVVTSPTTGTITIVKDTIPDDPQDFEFTRSFGENFLLDDDANPTPSNTITFSSLAPGTYNITEIEPSGWYLADIACTGGGNITIGDTGVTIDLDAGDDVTCTFTNCNNPPLEQSCGLDVVLVMDESGSIDNTEFGLMQAAFVAFVNALSSTPTQFALVDFGTVAHLRSDFTSNYTAIEALINDTKLGGGTQYTNWQDALSVAHGLFPNRGNPELIIFASDGNPNRIGAGQSASESAAMAAAVIEANAIKGDGIRIISIGIGTDLDTDNMIAVSCSDAMWETNFDDLANALAELASLLCGGTITVHKIIDCDGDINTTIDQINGEDWTFTANVAALGTSTPPSGDTGSDGLINFDIGFGGQCTATVSIVETLDSDFELLGATCTGATTNGSFDNTDSIDDIILDWNDIVTCTFYNRPLYTLTVESDGCCPINVAYDDFSANVTADDSQTFTGIPCGTDVTLTADEADCCNFVEWTGDVPSGHENDNPVTIHVNSDKSVTGHCTGVPVPTAAFNATPTSCCAPLEVNFTDQSTGNPTSWAWDFGDGNTSTDQHPSHTYNDPGIYTVSLNVTNACGWDDETKENYITVGGLPTADFEADKISCCAPLSVNFTDLSDPNNKEITSWAWDFGDGNTSTDQHPSHTYNDPGIYTVSLNVTNACGWDDETKENYITVGGLPTADFEADKISCCAPLSVNFTDLSDPNNKEITSWAWDFGDGNTSTDQHPSHTYNDPGIYTVSLNVTNACGWDVETKENYITVGGLPSADFNATPTNGCAPLRVNFTDLSDGNGKEIISWSWDFGDGGTSTSQNPSHTYTDPGTYTVSLNVSNGCGSDTEAKENYITARDCPPPVPPAGGAGCPSTKYLTVDWEGNNTTEPLYSNDKLAVDLLGPSPDGSHNLLLERGTHAPTVYEKTYYLIVIRELEEIPAPPENTVALVAFNITPPGAGFDRDIFLTLGLDELQLPENALNVTMAYYDDVNDVWVFLETELGEPNGVAELTLSAPINHFSIFGVLAELAPTPTPPAHFVASGLNIVTSVEKTTFVTKTGESVTITANVANDGWQEGTYTVELKLNGETVDTKMVTVGAGQSKPVSFTRAGLDYGQYEVEVAGLSGEFTTSRTITWWLILVIIAAIGLIIWGVVWGRRRRRRAAQEG